MSVRPPGEPTGPDSLSNWLRKLVRFARSLELKSSPGVRVKRGPDGTIIEIDPAKGGGKSGWRFAAPMEYDWINGAYGKDHVVVISPDNPACSVGINTVANDAHGILTGKDGTPHTDGEGEDLGGASTDSTDVATAGVWVCLRDPKVLSETQPEDAEAPRNYDIHVPIWPPPSFVPGDPDAEPPTPDALTLTVETDGKLEDNPENFWMLVGFIPIERTWCNATTGEPEQFYVQAVKIPEPPVDEEE